MRRIALLVLAVAFRSWAAAWRTARNDSLEDGRVAHMDDPSYDGGVTAREIRARGSSGRSNVIMRRARGKKVDVTGSRGLGTPCLRDDRDRLQSKDAGLHCP
jgi:hypothetical protein